ncbi:MAG: triose-phosphate isomerase [Patescibacteria group bacterium]
MKPIVIGNWKMNMNSKEAKVFIDTLLQDPNILTSASVTICPAAPVIPAVAEALRGTPIRWGGQNAHWEERGAFTGEASMDMLADLGCSVVLCGHSERRQHFHETDQDIGRKVQQALAHGITPVLCVGETYEQRHLQQHEVVVLEQVRHGVELLSAFPSLSLIIAYEPVWAIGTGQTIEPSDAFNMARIIRSTLREVLPTGADSIPVLYGGSTTPMNVASFVDSDTIAGVLVGGSSLNPVTFQQLITQLI